ncbi:MAG TPA: T9SS type A sorting domain-containing protein, partial [Ignavibacteriaceae bacterium]|nr:T9SS type A sorting domain-containing protein [Ignavibacteriaceae bacterium]
NYYYEPIVSCDFISEQVGWATFAEVSFNPVGIINTTDGGTTWNMQYIPDSLSFESINSVIFINDYKGWAAGSRYLESSESRILHTYDGGLNWETQNVPAGAALNSIFFINEFTGWAVGDSGTILRTTNGGVTFIEEEKIDELPSKFLLSQNYPNPFNNSSVIRFSIPKPSQVTLKIFNTLGEEIETLVNEEKPAGTYELTWNIVNLPSGVYFYRIKAGDFIQTKKMVLMK